MNIPDLREGIAYVEAELANIHQAADGRALTDDEQTRWDEGTAYSVESRKELEQLEARQAIVDRIESGRSVPQRADSIGGSFTHLRPMDTDVDVRSAKPAEVRDAARKMIDEARFLDADVQANAERRLYRKDGDEIARKLVVSESDAYRSAWQKNILGLGHLLTEQEKAAEVQFRAMSVGTTTAGGFGVPVLIDPTVMITDGTGLLNILPYCRVETVQTNYWKGVSAGHTAWSFDAEAAEVSDDTSTFAQPAVQVHMARGFIPYSIEIEQDYPGFAMEMGRLLSDGYVDLLAEKVAVGTGSDQPWGIFQTTTTTVDVTTDNTFGAPDIDKVWAALGERFRARSTWFMNVDVENDIRGFGSGTATSRFTVDQTREGISLLNGRPVVLSDWAPTWTGTDAGKILVLGDFSNFVIAQRAGMTVERVEHMVGTTSNRPTGERGFFAHARVGSDKAVINAFRVLKNITT